MGDLKAVPVVLALLASAASADTPRMPRESDVYSPKKTLKLHLTPEGTGGRSRRDARGTLLELTDAASGTYRYSVTTDLGDPSAMVGESGHVALFSWARSPDGPDDAVLRRPGTMSEQGQPRGAGGVTRAQEDKRETCWVPYISVEDPDAIVEKARNLGATIDTPPTAIPQVGRYSVITDPQGSHYDALLPCLGTRDLTAIRHSSVDARPRDPRPDSNPSQRRARS